MVVEEVGEVVWYEVLARHPQVHRVPVEELTTEMTGIRGVCERGKEGEEEEGREVEVGKEGEEGEGAGGQGAEGEGEKSSFKIYVLQMLHERPIYCVVAMDTLLYCTVLSSVCVCWCVSVLPFNRL